MGKYHEILEAIYEFEFEYCEVPSLLKIRKDIFDIIKKELEPDERIKAIVESIVAKSTEEIDDIVKGKQKIRFNGIECEIVEKYSGDFEFEKWKYDNCEYTLIADIRGYLIMKHYGVEHPISNTGVTIIQPQLREKILKMLRENMENREKECQKKP